MQDIREVYPDCGAEPFYGPGDYSPLLRSLGYEIVVQVDDDDYQGDSRLLLRDEAMGWGLLIFGWGSCSGCDALQACSTYAEIKDLRESLSSETQWFSTAAEAAGYLRTKEWDYEWHHGAATHSFVEQAQAVLDSIQSGTS